jgi:hypothetical protein
MKNIRAPDTGNFQAELLKYGGNELKKKMTEVVIKVWEVVKIPS